MGFWWSNTDNLKPNPRTINQKKIMKNRNNQEEAAIQSEIMRENEGREKENPAKNEKISNLMHRLDMIEMEIKGLRTEVSDEAEALDIESAISNVNGATERLLACWNFELAVRNINQKPE